MSAIGMILGLLGALIGIFGLGLGSMPFCGTSVVLLLLGALFVASGNSRARDRREEERHQELMAATRTKNEGGNS